MLSSQYLLRTPSLASKWAKKALEVNTLLLVSTVQTYCHGLINSEILKELISYCLLLLSSFVRR